MSAFVLERTQWVPQPLEETFEFYADPRIHALPPPKRREDTPRPKAHAANMPEGLHILGGELFIEDHRFEGPVKGHHGHQNHDIEKTHDDDVLPRHKEQTAK